MIVALSLATTSFSCLAFRSPPNAIQAASDKLSTLESNILGSFYSQHKAIPQTTIMGHVVLLLFQGALVHFARCSVAKTDDTGHLVNIINVKENLHERREEW